LLFSQRHTERETGDKVLRRSIFFFFFFLFFFFNFDEIYYTQLLVLSYFAIRNFSKKYALIFRRVYALRNKSTLFLSPSLKKHTHKQKHTQKKSARAHHSLDIQRRREVLSQTHAGKSLLSLRIQRGLQK